MAEKDTKPTLGPVFWIAVSLVLTIMLSKLFGAGAFFLILPLGFGVLHWGRRGRDDDESTPTTRR